MNLADLHNPREVTGLLHKNGEYIERDPDDQRWQERPGSWELWQMLDGRLMRVRRWLKKSIIAEYT